MRLAGSPSASRLGGSRCLARASGYRPRGHATATRWGRAANRGRLSTALRAGSAPHRRFPTRHPVSRKRSAVLADPLRAFSGGTPRLRYRPRGRYPPALSSTEVAWGRATARGDQTHRRSWVGAGCAGEPSTQLSRTRPCVASCRRLTARLITTRPHSLARCAEGSPLKRLLQETSALRVCVRVATALSRQSTSP